MRWLGPLNQMDFVQFIDFTFLNVERPFKFYSLIMLKI